MRDNLQRIYQSGFTLTELLIVIAIIGILAAVVLVQIRPALDRVYYNRALAEFRSFSTAVDQYRFANANTYPPDENRAVPAILNEQLAADTGNNGPWPGSVYDWDNWTIGGEQVVQLSIRFCPVGGTINDCNFPRDDWAEDFGVDSSVFYCFTGPCRSHESQPLNYPGYCVNCDCKEMATC